MAGVEAADAAATEPGALSFMSCNEAGSETVLLIHGGMGSRNDWDLIWPDLEKRYHLLIPDLPGHGKSSFIQPFTLTRSSQCLADLIRAHTHDHKAHIVGFSLGAIVAADLAANYPDVVKTVLVSGYIRITPSIVGSLVPYFFYLSGRVESLIPAKVVSYFMDGADMSPSSDRPSMEYYRAMSAAMVSSKPPGPIHARSLVIAATKRGLVPSNDRIEDAKTLARAAKSLNEESKMVEHPGMRHPWLRQDPQLFTQTVDAWICGRGLPDGFREHQL